MEKEYVKECWLLEFEFLVNLYTLSLADLTLQNRVLLWFATTILSYSKVLILPQKRLHCIPTALICIIREFDDGSASDGSITAPQPTFLKDLIFDQWRSAYAREPLFQVKCPWVLDVTAVEENHELRATKFEAISSSLRKLCKVGNWRLIRIGYHWHPLNGRRPKPTIGTIPTTFDAWSIFSPKWSWRHNFVCLRCQPSPT